MPGKRRRPTAVAMIFREMMREDRSQETIAGASILALRAIERRMAPLLAVHPIPIRSTRDMLREALPGRQSNNERVQLARLQLRLLEQGKARHSTSDSDFEAFYRLLDQYRIDF